MTTLIRVEVIRPWTRSIGRSSTLLSIEPRASFRTIADVIGTSDQTAARRYRRLEESAGLRVLGVPDGTRLGWTDWFLRLQTTPGGADSLAEALARRPDTRWVHLASGGTEIICTLQARTEEQRDALFLHGPAGQPPRRADLRALHPAQLHPGPVAAGHPRAVRGPAGPDPAAPGPQTRAPGPVLLAEDEPLLKELARDGRASSAALAAAIHWHESTVRRRIEELRQSGLLVFEVDVDNRVLGLNTHAMLWLSIEPARLEEAGTVLAGHPRSRSPPPPPGSTNLVASAVLRDAQHLYEYLTGELARLPGHAHGGDRARSSGPSSAPAQSASRAALMGPAAEIDTDRHADRDPGRHGERPGQGQQTGAHADRGGLPGGQRARGRRHGQVAGQARGLGDGPVHRAARRLEGQRAGTRRESTRLPGDTLSVPGAGGAASCPSSSPGAGAVAPAEPDEPAFDPPAADPPEDPAERPARGRGRAAGPPPCRLRRSRLPDAPVRPAACQ